MGSLRWRRVIVIRGAAYPRLRRRLDRSRYHRIVEADRFRQLLEDRAVLLAAGHGCRTQREDDQTLAVRVREVGVDLEERLLRKTAVDGGRNHGLADRGGAAGQFEVLDVRVALVDGHRTGGCDAARRHHRVAPGEREEGKQRLPVARARLLHVVTVQADRAVDSAHLAQRPQQLLPRREVRDELLASQLVRRRVEERSGGGTQILGGGEPGSGSSAPRGRAVKPAGSTNQSSASGSLTES